MLKSSQVRIRVNPEAEKLVEELAGEALTKADMVSVIFHAGVAAIRQSGNVHQWPIRLQVAKEDKHHKAAAA